MATVKPFGVAKAVIFSCLLCLNIAVAAFHYGDYIGRKRSDDEALAAQVAVARQMQKFKHASAHMAKVTIWTAVDRGRHGR